MTKAWCIWCENGSVPKNQYFWIHNKCAQKMMDLSDDIKSIRKMLEGEHARNRFEKKGKSKIDIIYEFIKDMEDFRKQWEGSIKLIQGGEK